ncbi:MAG TPA: nitroreductase family protein, partial [Oscillospiraceae bacterium]|nr:nitroreductase family protein [Oscillospiraceae bacterium]
MDYTEIIKARHSVRRYTDKKIEGETLEELNGIIDLCNRESGLNIQLYLDEPEAFSGRMA